MRIRTPNDGSYAIREDGMHGAKTEVGARGGEEVRQSDHQVRFPAQFKDFKIQNMWDRERFPILRV